MTVRKEDWGMRVRKEKALVKLEREDIVEQRTGKGKKGVVEYSD